MKTDESDIPAATRDRILLAALPAVCTKGWDFSLFEQAAGECGLPPGSARQAFPNGRRDAIAHLSDWADRRMLDSVDIGTLESLRVRDRITVMVFRILEVLAPWREAVRRAIGRRTVDFTGCLGLPGLWRTADRIWIAAGDTATDYNYYTKRFLLASVLASTLLFWLTDNSEHFTETRYFLDRRIGNALTLGKLAGRFTTGKKAA